MSCPIEREAVCAGEIAAQDLGRTALGQSARLQQGGKFFIARRKDQDRLSKTNAQNR